MLMANARITDSIYSVGILNPAMRVFDVVMQTEYGTSYNSYVLMGSEKNVLIETCHKTYFKQYLENVKEVIDPSKIDYIILNHNEPDHTGALAKLLEYMPNAQIIVSQAGSIYLKNITNRSDLNLHVVKNGDVLNIGGKTLKFILAPFLHWPDSMFTWVEEEKTLFSCDFLGSHYCEPYAFDFNIAYPEKYDRAFRYYFEAICGPFKPYVLAGLDKIKELPIDFLCTSHGPILTKDCRLKSAIQKYSEWSQPHKNEELTVPIFYTTAYGNTRQVAKAIRDGILQAKPTADVELFDMIHCDMGKMAEKLNESDAFVLGSPTINADAVPPAWELLSHVDVINNKKKPAFIFGSYGWSGEAIPNLTARLIGLKLNVFNDGFKICFVPSEQDLDKAREIGRTFGETLEIR